VVVVDIVTVGITAIHGGGGRHGDGGGEVSPPFAVVLVMVGITCHLHHPGTDMLSLF